MTVYRLATTLLAPGACTAVSVAALRAGRARRTDDVVTEGGCV